MSPGPTSGEHTGCEGLSLLSVIRLTQKSVGRANITLVTSDSPKAVTCPCLDSSDDSDDDGSKENQCFESTRNRPALGCVFKPTQYSLLSSMEFLQDGFYPHFPDKENESHQGFSSWPKITQKARGRAKIQAQTVCLQNLCSKPLFLALRLPIKAGQRNRPDS